jgi:hypothetical protein
MRTVRLQHGISLSLVLVIAAWLSLTAARPQGSLLTPEYEKRSNMLRQAPELLGQQWETLPPSAKVIAYIERFTPFYSWILLCNAVDDEYARFTFLLGGCLEEQHNSLWAMPTDQFISSYGETLDKLWVRSPLAAIKFAEKFFRMSSQDKLQQNVLSLFQLGLLAFLVFQLFRITLKRLALLLLGSGTILVIGNILLQILIYQYRRNADLIFLLNFRSLFEMVVGGVTVFLALVWLGRWGWSKRNELPELQK